MNQIACLLVVALTAARMADAADAVRPSIAAPLFEKQKKVRASVHAQGKATLSLVSGETAHQILSTQVSESAVTFDLATIDEETLSLPCWSTGAIAKLQGTKLSTAQLEGLAIPDSAKDKLKAGTFDADLVEALRPARLSAAVLKLLKPSADAASELRKTCRWPLDYAEIAKAGLKKAMIVRLTDAGGKTDEQVVAQTSSVKVFLHPPKEGDQVIKGEVVGDADKVRVEVYDTRGLVVDFDTATVDAASSTQPAKTFTAGMNRRLAAGQTVRVIAYKADAELNATDYTLVETVGFDWGRVRAYFSAGATVATGEVESTRSVPATATTPAQTIPEVAWKLHSADYFVGLNLDYNWFSTLHDRSAFPCPMPAKDFEQLTDLENWIDQVQARAHAEQGEKGRNDIVGNRPT